MVPRGSPTARSWQSAYYSCCNSIHCAVLSDRRVCRVHLGTEEDTGSCTEKTCQTVSNEFYLFYLYTCGISSIFTAANSSLKLFHMESGLLRFSQGSGSPGIRSAEPLPLNLL